MHIEYHREAFIFELNNSGVKFHLGGHLTSCDMASTKNFHPECLPRKGKLGSKPSSPIMPVAGSSFSCSFRALTNFSSPPKISAEIILPPNSHLC